MLLRSVVIFLPSIRDLTSAIERCSPLGSIRAAVLYFPSFLHCCDLLSCCAVRLVDGDLWLKLLPVLNINTGDCVAGVFQQQFVANDAYHHKTASRLVVIDAPDHRFLIGMLHTIHIDAPLLFF